MSRRVVLALAGCVLFGALGWQSPPGGGAGPADTAAIARRDTRLLALERENGCLDEPDAGAAAPQAWPDWAAAHIAGGDVAAGAGRRRSVPDAAQRRRRSGQRQRVRQRSQPPRALVVRPARRVEGQRAGRAADRHPRSGDRHDVHRRRHRRSRGAGDLHRRQRHRRSHDGVPLRRRRQRQAEARRSSVPHQAWGLSINPVRKEIAVSVEGPRQIVVYTQTASGTDAPLRMIRGPKTGLGDPHGVFFDGKNNEIVVANHGNQNGRETLPGSVAAGRRGGGRRRRARRARRRPLRRAVDHRLPRRGHRRRRADPQDPGDARPA